jgi:hypothetical protein
MVAEPVGGGQAVGSKQVCVAPLCVPTPDDDQPLVYFRQLAQTALSGPSCCPQRVAVSEPFVTNAAACTFWE